MTFANASAAEPSGSPAARVPLAGWLVVAWLCLGAGRLGAAEVLPGIDVLRESGFAALRGRRVGLITNPTGVDRRGEQTWKILRRAPGVKLAALFGAEHGFFGREKAGVEIPDTAEPSTGLPIFSLYGPGPTRAPTPRMLQGIDVMVYDLQDTGCRSYTYISTLGRAMEACAAQRIPFVVLDRPNPLGGVRVEGPGLDPRFRSFVGEWPVPYVYGLTPGELARTINGEGWIRSRCELTVVPLRGWDRRQTWNDTGLSWIPTSPNVPRGDTPMYLVATGVLGEIGGLNLATGTGNSFRMIGAPWLDAEPFARQMNRYRLPGVRFETAAMDFNRRPDDGAEGRGVRVRFTEPATAPLAAVNFHVLEAIRKTTGRDLFKQAIERGKSWAMFDKVTGSDRIRKAMQAGRSAQEIAASWREGEAAFRKLRKPYLLYPETSASSNPHRVSGAR